jgi:hypothetical protein
MLSLLLEEDADSSLAALQIHLVGTDGAGDG